MNVPLWAWIALVLGTVVVIAVDLLFISKGDKEMSLRSALTWTGIWLSLGLLFAVVVGVAFDTKYATEYLSGFLLEYSLSMDNVFVFIVLFAFFAVPPWRALMTCRRVTVGLRPSTVALQRGPTRLSSSSRCSRCEHRANRTHPVHPPRGHGVGSHGAIG